SAAVAGSWPNSLSGRRTLPDTLAHGIRVGSWNTKPSAPGAGLPALHSIVPLVGAASPAISRSAVDLPQPDGPSSETNSPRRTAKSKPSSAATVANAFPTPRRATMGEASLTDIDYFGRSSRPTPLSTNCNV